MSTYTPSNAATSDGQVLKAFQLDNIPISKKSDKAFGLQMSKFIETTINSGYGGYYFARNGRYKVNRDWANGRIDVRAKFSDRLEMNGKFNYANLGWQPIQIVNRIITGLVGRWMGRNEKIEIDAIDPLSTTQKRREYENIEFLVANRRMAEELQKESGIQMIPDEGIPADMEELNLWASRFQRIPEEILFELGCNDVLRSNGFYTVNKEKGLHDSAECGFVGTYTWMDDTGVIHVEPVKPENAIYSYSDFADFRDTKWRGRVVSKRISDLRREYGAEFGGPLTEQQLWEIACMSKDYQLEDKLTWNLYWQTAFMRPYDEYNVDVIEFELRSVDIEPYTVVTTKKNKSTLLIKGRKEKRGDNEQIIEDKKQNIYRGVYVRNSDFLLEWGLKTNMIRPQDPKELGSAEFSYSFYMYQPYQMRNIALPQKIEEPVEQMILARLKMEQLVARMRPTGAAVDVSALDNIDYGLGDKNKDVDYKKLYDQTGDIYYRGVDAEGKRVPVPITELQNSGFLGQLQGLILLYDKHYQILKDELGEDPALISQALQPRVTASNVDVAQRSSENATDYMYRAYAECMKDTAKKISCLLKSSVTYGSKVYREILNQEDVAGRVFGTDIKFLPNDYELAKLEGFLNNAIAANPTLVIYLDPFQVMRVAKENVTLAEQLIRSAQKRMYITERQREVENQNITFEGQAQSAERSEKAKQETEATKGNMEVEKAKVAGEMQLKNTMAASIMKMYETGIPIPPELKPMADALINNVLMPSVIQNQQTQQAVADQAVQQEQELDSQPQQNIQAA